VGRAAASAQWPRAVIQTDELSILDLADRLVEVLRGVRALIGDRAVVQHLAVSLAAIGGGDAVEHAEDPGPHGTRRVVVRQDGVHDDEDLLNEIGDVGVTHAKPPQRVADVIDVLLEDVTQIGNARVEARRPLWLLQKRSVVRGLRHV
jgi:hypothetical protein